jgi:hypothetical protein
VEFFVSVTVRMVCEKLEENERKGKLRAIDSLYWKKKKEKEEEELTQVGLSELN